MPRFLLITSRTENFNPDVLPQHFEYLDRLRAKGVVELSGGFSDKTGGAYLITAETQEAAEKIAQADPLIASGSSKITVKEWLAK